MKDKCIKVEGREEELELSNTMEAVVAIMMVVTAIIKEITTKVAITDLKETNKDLSAVNDQTPEVEQETTITTTTNSSAKMINIAGTCPTRRCKKEEEDGKITKDRLPQIIKRKISKRKRPKTLNQKRRSKFRRHSLRFSPSTRRSRHCRV